jgi:hypothetical protein
MEIIFEDFSKLATRIAYVILVSYLDFSPVIGAYWDFVDFSQYNHVVCFRYLCLIGVLFSAFLPVYICFNMTD